MDTETLNQMADSLARYGRERYGFEARSVRLASVEGFGRDAWADYARMGLLAMPQTVDAGGFDSAPEAVGVMMQHMGASLALEPVFASVVLCGRMLALAGDVAAARDSLRELAEGRIILALAHAEDASEGMQGEVQSRWHDGRLSGRKLVVLHGDSAERLVVSARDAEGALGLFVVDVAAPHVTRKSYRLVDGRGAATIEFHGATALAFARGAVAETILLQSLDEARLALCAEAYGAGKALNAATLAYLKERRQFDRPIGTNQALQHRMVELYMLEEECRATMQMAYRAQASQRQAAIYAALAQATTLARQAAHEAVQMHGGIGVTEELAVSHFFRRLMVIERLLGDRDLHLRRFAVA